MVETEAAPEVSTTNPRKTKPAKRSNGSHADAVGVDAVERLIAEQQRTNDLLQRLLATLHEPIAVELLRKPPA